MQFPKESKKKFSFGNEIFENQLKQINLTEIDAIDK